MEDRPRKEDRARTTTLILGYLSAVSASKSRGPRVMRTSLCECPYAFQVKPSARLEKFAPTRMNRLNVAFKMKYKFLLTLLWLLPMKKRPCRYQDQPCNLIDSPSFSNSVIILYYIILWSYKTQRYFSVPVKSRNFGILSEQLCVSLYFSSRLMSYFAFILVWPHLHSRSDSKFAKLANASKALCDGSKASKQASA